jgi:6-phosphofructokinase 2
MSLILTLTPNPAIDVATSTARVESGRKLRCSPAAHDPGGGGVNVARVAGRLGAAAVAIYPAGGSAGEQLQQLVRRERLESVVVPVKGDTREDFTVLDETTHEEYRFVLPGPRLGDAEWMACLEALAGFERKPDFICASGSLPPGAPTDFYARAAEIADLRGVRFALDASGAPLESALRELVHLAKPNLAELRALVGGALADEPSRIAACRDVIAMGRTQAVALTLGAEGALLVTRDEAWRSPALPVRPVSTVGAGDSFLGAMVWALAEGKALTEAFRYGCAAGAAALTAHGTGLCRASDVSRLVGEVALEAVAGSRTPA